ncbi:MAG: hypothetical protein LBO66_10605 [Deltaproteobacteria bacterium]|jgi:hypothetical protein|nr:hypothetical protein [Deltaproteobacteria bacterium]
MTAKHIRFFNTSGPNVPTEHYTLPILPRLGGVHELIDQKLYFVLHAPRQSGKTTYFKFLTDAINSGGNYYALYASLARVRRIEDREKAIDYIIGEINSGLDSSKEKELAKLAYAFVSKPYMSSGSGNPKLKQLLRDICRTLDRDLVIFFDEADSFEEGPLIEFLTQIRDGYITRADSYDARFPRSLALIGMRDFRDYASQVRPDDQSLGLASPFNVKEESLTLANFSKDDIINLYCQHSAETGQVFEPSAFDQAWRWTEGQPWLVNALVKQVIVKEFKNDYSRSVTGSDIDKAAQDLILRNDTHFDSLKHRIEEPRVSRVMEAVLIGMKSFPDDASADDIQYSLDLGLLKKGPEDTYQPANPIYQEVILRALISQLKRSVKAELPTKIESKWMDGTNLDMDGLLKAFQDFWRKNGEMASANERANNPALNKDAKASSKRSRSAKDGKITRENDDASLNYQPRVLSHEGVAHLVLLSFLQRALNGGVDSLSREYALGKKRIDVLVTYKGSDYPLEIKLKGVQSLKESLERLSSYMDKLGVSKGWLVIFDKNFNKPWDQKIFMEIQEYEGKIINIFGC